MLTRAATGAVAAALAFAVVVAPGLASAGGVIIDGRTDTSYGLPVGGTLGDQPEPAGIPDLQPMDEALTQQEQEVLLWAAMVFGGHDAAAQNPESDESVSEIIDDLEGGEPQSGCAATPVSGLSVLGAVVLALRRRRR